MGDLLKFQLPETPPRINKFDQLIRAEIKRMKTSKKIQPPEFYSPMSIQDYSDMLHEEGLMPNQEQVKRFILNLMDDSLATKFADLQVCPVILPYSHQMEPFSERRIERFGYLQAFVTTSDSFTFGLENPIYLKSILPMDLVRKNPKIPAKLTTVEDLNRFNQELTRAIIRLIRLSA